MPLIKPVIRPAVRLLSDEVRRRPSDQAETLRLLFFADFYEVGSRFGEATLALDFAGDGYWVVE